MATSLVSLVRCNAVKLLANRACITYQTVRFRRAKRVWGTSYENARSYEERMAELKSQEPILNQGINIGFPLRTASFNSDQLHKDWLKKRLGKEQQARKRELIISLEDVKAKWQEEQGSRHVHQIAKHHGIYQDMFDHAFFYPATDIDISYDYNEDFVTMVFTGNKISPADAAECPYVTYQSDDKSLWTLVMSSPDGHLEQDDKECLHWMVANIPGNDVEKGEVICDYMQPFPPKGTGHLRYVFILYKQSEKLDLGQIQRPSKCLSLQERTFSTLSFYSERQDVLTPAGLAFFQSEWDPSVREFFQNKLEMPEPAFEFMHPPPYHPKQVKYPHKEPFNLYLDRYRHIKDINEEVLKEKLKRISPFRPNKPNPLYPGIVPLPKSMPSWLKTRTRNIRFGRHQWKGLPGE
ncbi:large ribosomal subunit protein mL38-like [Haliotis asinina]|uniref:large ribosomal subunit protein mL38-like n=1 Tax=Haliotis asinina TaxID=109174 RepID=UPI003531DAA6